MTRITTFEVRKDDLARSRLAESTAPALKDGEVLAKVDRFALTANNVTYGVVGEKIGYWKFFPAEEGWGVIPVWGFADVVESKCADIKPGERLYGYFPMASHLVLSPVSVKQDRLVDGAAHRSGLPQVYNSYVRVNAEPHHDPAMDDERMLLFPLYATSFCLYDFLLDNKWFDSRQVVIVSASSKTAIGLAIALAGDKTAPPAIALTSVRNLPMVRSIGLYANAYSYENLASIDNTKPTAIVDMSGNGMVLSDLHEHLAENMRYCSNVGVTHYEENTMGPAFNRDRSAMFFAPGHIQERAKEWGPGAFEKKAFVFWRDAAVKSRAFLKLDRVRGASGMTAAYDAVRRGESPPDTGLIVEL
jgi:hypothetical protein